MSGREFEPVAAFFPSIDRNLIRDLDRHLRAAPSSSPVPTADKSLERPDITGVVEAIETAGTTLAAMTTQIQELQSDAAKMEATNARLRQKIGDVTHQNQALEANLRVETQKAEEAGILAAENAARADALERELAYALADLNRVTEAISAALGVPQAR